MRFLAEKWSALPDVTVSGSTLLATTGVWYRRSGWSFSRSKEMFHNGECWIWGMQITLASCVLQVSNEKDWSVKATV